MIDVKVGSANAVHTSIGGASYSVSASWWNRIRTRTFVVADMTGDSGDVTSFERCSAP